MGVGIIELRVFDAKALFLHVVPEVSHGGKEEYDTLPVTAMSFDFIPDFRHDENILMGVGEIKQTRITRQLVTENWYEISCWQFGTNVIADLALNP